MDKSQYKNVFVFCEQREGKLQNVALELLGKAHDLAKDLDQQVYAMLLGHNVKNLAQDRCSRLCTCYQHDGNC